MRSSFLLSLLGGLSMVSIAAFAQEAETSDVQSEPPAEQDMVPAEPNPLDDLLPLRPEEIVEAFKRKEAHDRTIALPVAAPVGDSKMVVIKNSPGAPIPEIVIAPNFSTLVSIVDATGAPWPVQTLSVGAADQVDAATLSTGKFLLSQKTPYASTNLTVVLAGDDAPVFTLRLGNQQGFVNEQMTFQIPARGPQAVAPVINKKAEMTLALGGEADEQALVGFLDGNVPAEAQPLNVDMGDDIPADVKAWSYKDFYWVLSRPAGFSANNDYPVLRGANVLSSAKGGHGISVVKIIPTPAITLTADGQLFTIRLRNY